MSYEDKVQSARELIDSHNNSENLPKESKVDVEAFFNALCIDGGTTENSLRKCSWEDLQKYGLPKLLACNVSEVFRQSEKKKATSSWDVSPRKAEKMLPLDLIKAFDPDEPDSYVGKRLKEFSKNQPFLVFGEDGKVDSQSSEALLAEIRKGYTPREYYEIDGITKGVYPIGDGPSRLADQNPLWTREILRPDGTCSQTARSCKTVPLVVKQIIFLARNRTTELVIDNVQDAHNTIDLAITDNADTKIRQRCPKASKLFEELRATGEVPSLRVPLNGRKSQGSNDPFFSGSHRSY